MVKILNFKKKILFIIFTVIYAQLVAQHPKIIMGMIYDGRVNQPLPFVHIQIKNTGIGTISDQNGNFYFKSGLHI
ncbi:MAG: carboxypeptidase-like regulatory domain-containing protein [Chloroflexia bacterium]|nr:carboxypeptidase-like regulatory domain-containing protein [Chloroflexia bacterium]